MFIDIHNKIVHNCILKRNAKYMFAKFVEYNDI